MFPYLLANLLSITIVFSTHFFKLNKVATSIFYLIASIPIIVIAGFKSNKVGTDTDSYIYFYKQITSFDVFLDFINHQGEAAYWMLNFIGNQITHNYFILFTFTAILVSLCYSYSLRMFNLKSLSIATLLLIGPYYFQLNGNRQAITIAIFAVSVVFIIKKQPIRYIASIMIGFLFHKSIIICLPLYLIFIGEIKARKVAIIITLFLLFIIFFQYFISVASSVDARYSSYGDRQEQSGGVVVSSFNVILLLWFAFCRKINAHILGNKVYDTLLVLYLLGSLISILSVVLGIDPSGFLRLSLYFIQMNMFLLPMSFNSFKDEQTRYILILCGVILMVLYFYMTTSAFSNLTPYKFNPIVGEILEN